MCMNEKIPIQYQFQVSLSLSLSIDVKKSWFCHSHTHTSRWQADISLSHMLYNWWISYFSTWNFQYKWFCLGPKSSNPEEKERREKVKWKENPSMCVYVGVCSNRDWREKNFLIYCVFSPIVLCYMFKSGPFLRNKSKWRREK